MGLQKEKVLAELTELKPLLRQQGVVHIGIFGSVVKDRSDTYSDIDIAFEKNRADFIGDNIYNYFEKVTLIKQLLQERFSKRVDLFDLYASTPLKEQICKEIVYAR